MPSGNTSKLALIVQQGKVLDFIDGTTQREETPEEYVRQEIAKSLIREYGYSKKDVAVEFILRVGVRKPRADLVLFITDAEHRQENALIIVECKAQTVKANDRKEGIGQLQSYMSVCPNSIFGMWTNGVERYCYRKVVRNGLIAFEDVPDLPSFGEDLDDVERPRFDKLKPASSDALLFAFRRCHNYIAGNQGLQKPEAFWELLKLIFCKIHDERSSSDVQFFAGANERSSINGYLKVKARIDKLFAAVKADYASIFPANEAIGLTPAVLAYIVSQLQIYSLLESDVDVKGHAYEEIVGANLRGDRGEFFTPRNICNMAVAMLQPREDQLILDPACGTGGFLIAAMSHVIETVRKGELARWGDIERADSVVRQRVTRFAERHILGIDFNPNLVKASKMNMVMNNDGAGGLFQANSLASPATWDDDLRVRGVMGQVDLIFTNPPFGSKIPVDDPAILEKFDLGHIWNYDQTADLWRMTKNTQRSQPPEILFIERCVKFLKPGTGRAAMVLPDGILGAPGLGYVREWLLTNTRILASVDLHPDTFQPNVSVQTSILIVQRKTDDEIALERASGRQRPYEVFMAMADHIGHDKRGNKTYVRDEKGNEIAEEIVEIVKEYDEGKAIYRHQTTQRKIVDDNTQQIAGEFRAWLREQD